MKKINLSLLMALAMGKMETSKITLTPEWPKLIIYTVLMYLAWNWKDFIPVLIEGALIGPDDFLRLHQVMNWLNGQGWYDMTAYRMGPLAGADIHWSRLIDLPIALLIHVFSIFTDTQTAGRLTAIVWPFILMIGSTVNLTIVCDRLIGSYNRLYVIFFTMLSTSSVLEFSPGRIDHHNVQIFLLTLIMLALVLERGWISNALIAITIPFSISIGLDSLLVFLPILAYFGFLWVLDTEKFTASLMQIGTVMFVASLMLYAVNISPSQWYDDRCDAFSLVYLEALLLVSASYLIMYFCTGGFVAQNTKAAKLNRLALGIILAIISILILYAQFPYCTGGPLEALSPQAHTVWLSTIQEAKGAVEMLQVKREFWISDIIYMALMLAVILFVFLYGKYDFKIMMVLGMIAIISILGTLIQIRILRIGIYAVIPFCVIFSQMNISWLKRVLPNARIVAASLHMAVCIVMTSFFWLALSKPFTDEVSSNTQNIDESQIQTARINEAQTSKSIDLRPRCNWASDMKLLASLSSGLVMADINSATPILVNTSHSVIAGPYHRNEKKVLEVYAFLGGSIEQAKVISQELKLDYVAICNLNANEITYGGKDSLYGMLAADKVPDWLERLSNKTDKLTVYSVAH